MDCDEYDGGGLSYGVEVQYDVKENLFFFEVDDELEANLPHPLRERSSLVQRREGGGGDGALHKLRIFVRPEVMAQLELELEMNGGVAFISNKPSNVGYAEYAQGLAAAAAGGGDVAQADGGRRRAPGVQMTGGGTAAAAAAAYNETAAAEAEADEDRRGTPLQLAMACVRGGHGAMLTGPPTAGDGVGLQLAAWEAWRTLRGAGVRAHLVAPTLSAALALLEQRSAADEAVTLNIEDSSLLDDDGRYRPLPILDFLGISRSMALSWTTMRQPTEAARLEAERVRGAARVSGAARARADQTLQAARAAAYTLPPLVGPNDELAPPVFDTLRRTVFVRDAASLQRWMNTRVLVVASAELLPAWILRLIQDVPARASPTGPQQNVNLDKMVPLLVGDYASRPVMPMDSADVRQRILFRDKARAELARERGVDPSALHDVEVEARAERLRCVPALRPAFETEVFRTLVGDNIFSLPPAPPAPISAGIEADWAALLRAAWSGRLADDTPGAEPTAAQVDALETALYGSVSAATEALSDSGRCPLPVQVVPDSRRAQNINAEAVRHQAEAGGVPVVTLRPQILSGVEVNARGTQRDIDGVRSGTSASQALATFLERQWPTAREETHVCVGARVAMTRRHGGIPYSAVGTVLAIGDDAAAAGVTPTTVRVLFDGHDIPTDVAVLEMDTGLMWTGGGRSGESAGRVGYRFTVRVMPLRLAYALPGLDLVGLRLEHTGLVVGFWRTDYHNDTVIMAATRVPYAKLALAWTDGCGPNASDGPEVGINPTNLALRKLAPPAATARLHRLITCGYFARKRHDRFVARQERILRTASLSERPLKGMPSLVILFRRKHVLMQLESARQLLKVARQLKNRRELQRQGAGLLPLGRAEAAAAVLSGAGQSSLSSAPNSPTSAASLQRRMGDNATATS